MRHNTQRVNGIASLTGSFPVGYFHTDGYHWAAHSYWWACVFAHSDWALVTSWAPDVCRFRLLSGKRETTRSCVKTAEETLIS